MATNNKSMASKDDILLKLRREFTEDERTTMLFERYTHLLSLNDENEKTIETLRSLKKKHSEVILGLEKKIVNQRSKINNQRETIVNLHKAINKLKAEIKEKFDPEISAYLKGFDNL